MLLEKIQADIISAMKAKDELRLETLRSVKAALDRFRTDQQKPITEAVEQNILATLSKQRKEAAEAFRTGAREALALKEEAELVILQGYMLVEATEAEIDAAIERALPGLLSTGPKALGIVMREVKQTLAGKRVDGKILSDKIKARFAAAEASGETFI